MEQILSKLSDIEITAKSIQADADKTKNQLSEEAEQQCRDFDAALEQQTASRIRQIRDGLEKEKDNQLTALNQNTASHLAALDSYFTANHERLSQELFQRILKR